jgi:protein O-mannosyl-transferase
LKNLPAFFSRLDRAGNRTLYLLFFLICLVLYFKCLTNGYSLDDDYIVNDKSVQQGLKSAKEIFSSRYISYYHTNYEYRPLTKLVFAIEHQLFGLKAGIAHFINILIYFFVAVLFFRTLMLLRFIPGKAFAAAATLLFLFHPLHSEVVCSIKNLDVLLSAVFSLLSCISVLRYLQHKRIHFLVMALVWLICGMLSKLDALPFFGIIPALIWLQDPGKWKFSVLSFISLVVVYLIFAKTRKWVLNDAEDLIARKMLYHENPLAELKGIKFKLMAIFSSLGFYTEKLILGFPLVCYYGYNTLSMDQPFGQRFIYTGFIVVLLLMYASWKNRKNPLLLFCLLFFFAPLSMYLNFPKPAPGIVADRFTFMSSAGFSLLICYFTFRFFARKQLPVLTEVRKNNAVVLILLLVCTGYGFTTIRRCFDWKSHLSLVEADLEKVPRSAMMHFLRGSFRLNEAKEKTGEEKKFILQLAIESFEESLGIYKENGSAWNNIGGIYFFQYRDFAKAYPYFKKAFALDPHSDNKILFAKSAFLSDKKNEFYEMAVKEINQSANKEMIQFVNEFKVFLGKEKLIEAYNGLINTGLANDTLRFDIISETKLKADEVSWALMVAKAYRFGYRFERDAREAALILYDNGKSKEASALMDILEGKAEN